MRTRIKFCGITRLEDALLAAELGIDVVGFVLVPGTPRYRGLDAAAELRHKLPASLKVAALVQNASADELAAIQSRLRPHLRLARTRRSRVRRWEKRRSSRRRRCPWNHPPK